LPFVVLVLIVTLHTMSTILGYLKPILEFRGKRNDRVLARLVAQTGSFASLQLVWSISNLEYWSNCWLLHRLGTTWDYLLQWCGGVL